jgi:hypothetical protein
MVQHNMPSVLQNLWQSNQDAVAFGITTISMVLFVESVKALRSIPPAISRKITHVGAGPIFLLHWPLFTKRDGSAWAAAVPLIMTRKFASPSLPRHL